MEKIWLKSYGPGIAKNIDPDAYDSLISMFKDACLKYQDKVAFTHMGVTLSYRALDGLSDAFASGLMAQGLKAGDRVGIMMPNVLQYPIVLWGILKAGLVVVNINPQYTPREFLVQLRDSECVSLVVLDLFYPKLQPVLVETNLKHVFVTSVGDYLGFKGFCLNFGLKLCRKAPWFIWSTSSTRPLKSFIRQHDNNASEFPEIKSEKVAFLQYTGGTTGTPKGAMLTHRNMVANILQAEAWLKKVIRPGEEVIVTALPLYHIFSLMANALLFFKLGGNNILITNPRDPKSFIRALKSTRFTAMTGVNTLFHHLCQDPGFQKLDFSYLRISLGGGMAVQRAVAREWQRVTGVALLQAYGLTEASPAVCINPMNSLDFSESVGLPIPSTEVKVCDDNGQEVDIGEEGELWVKGPQVMKGYWNNPDETAEVLTQDGFLKTGDMVSIDNRGFVRILERKKEIILISGFNVYPNEVEDVIAMHPAVKEVGVTGTMGEDEEEVVTAFIIKKLDSLTEKEVLNHCRKFLTKYKIPKKIIFRESLPKSTVGKILRRALS